MTSRSLCLLLLLSLSTSPILPSRLTAEEPGAEGDKEDEDFDSLVAEPETTDYEKLVDTVFIEAEEFDGVKAQPPAWTVVDRNDVSRQCILQVGAGEISRRFRVNTAGNYRVWVHYVLHPADPAPFTVVVRQKDQVRLNATYHAKAVGKGTAAKDAEKTHQLWFDNPVTREGMILTDEPAWQFRQAQLEAGEGLLSLSVPTPRKRELVHTIDCVLLTRSESYRPHFDHFQDLMVRVRAAEVEPADVEMTMDIGVYWAAVRIIRGQQRVGDGVAGILDDKGKPIRQGVWSRWVNVREQVGLGSHENTVSFRLNSRPPITRVKGEVEVAWGSLPGQVVRRYVQDSEGPAFGILLPNQYVRTRDDVVEGVWPAGYLKWISSISEKSEGHIKTILAMPFPAGGTPKLYSFFTGVAGYGGCHYSKAIQANELRCAALLGINAPFYLSPQNLKFAQEQGLAESLVPRTMSGSAGGPPSKACVSDPANEARIRRTSADYLESVRQTMPEAVNTTWIMKNGDEIGFAAGPEHIEQCESCVALFRRYLSERGLTPAEMGASDWSQVRPAYNLSPAGKAARRLHYFTTLFLSYNTAQLYRKVVASHAETFPSRPYVYSNYQPTPIWSGMGLDWFIMGQERAFSVAWAEDWLWGQPRWEQVSFVSDVLRNIAEENQMPFGMYLVAGTGGFRRKTMSLFGRGAVAMIVYNWGPRFGFGDQFSEAPAVQQEVGQTTRLVAAAEDALYGSRPVPAKIALLYSRSEEIWQQDEADVKNRIHVYLALLHDQVPVDLITEDQVAAGKLKNYSVFYLSSQHVQRRAAAQIRDWVTAGGAIWADGQSATRDEYDERMDVLDETLGRQYLHTERSKRFVGGLGYGALGAPIGQATLQPPGWDQPQAADVFVYRAVVTPGPGATVVGTFPDGPPAVLVRKTGRGQALYFTFPVGMTYRRRLDEKDFDPSKDYRAEERSLISRFALAADVVRPVELSAPVIEAIATEGKNGRAVVLVNYRFRPVDALRVSILETPKAVPSVRSVLHGPLKVAHENGRAIVELSIDEADVLVLD